VDGRAHAGGIAVTAELPAVPRDEAAQRIRAHLGQAVVGFIAAGRDLAIAKESIPHGEFEAWVQEQVGISTATAQRLMAVARHPALANPSHAQLLPPAWTTLYELSRLPAQLLERAIETGEVGPDLERDEARELVGRYVPPDYENWSEDERALLKRLRGGEAIVVSQRGAHDNLIGWAESAGLYVRIDRRTDWGNPFETPADGNRATVIDSYACHYLPYKPSLLKRIESLHGKALGCWCAPEPCHGDVLADVIAGTSQYSAIYVAFRELEPGEC
jgi:hypothetical protein